MTTHTTPPSIDQPELDEPSIEQMQRESTLHAAVVMLGKAFGIEANSPAVQAAVAIEVQAFDASTAGDDRDPWMITMDLSRAALDRHMAAFGRLEQLIRGDEFTKALQEFVIARELLALSGRRLGSKASGQHE